MLIYCAIHIIVPCSIFSTRLGFLPALGLLIEKLLFHCCPCCSLFSGSSNYKSFSTSSHQSKTLTGKLWHTNAAAESAKLCNNRRHELEIFARNKRMNNVLPLCSKLEGNSHLTYLAGFFLNDFISLSQSPILLTNDVLETRMFVRAKSLKDPRCEIGTISLLRTLAASSPHFH